jgi:hypothetical protein
MKMIITISTRKARFGGVLHNKKDTKRKGNKKCLCTLTGIPDVATVGSSWCAPFRSTHLEGC